MANKGLLQGKTKVQVAGCRERLSDSSVFVAGVSIHALAANRGRVYFGADDVAHVNADELQPGERIHIPVPQVSLVYIDADVGGDGVSWHAIPSSTTTDPIESDSPEESTKSEFFEGITWYKVLAAFGLLTTLAIAAYVLVADGKVNTPAQLAAMRWLMAIGAGCAGTSLGWVMKVEGTARKITLSAAGGAALFCLVFFFLFGELPAGAKAEGLLHGARSSMIP